MDNSTQTVDGNGINATALVHQYDHEYQAYRVGLNLPAPHKHRAGKNAAMFPQLLMGSFLVLCALSTVGVSSYIDYRIQKTSTTFTSDVQQKTWVFPAYFMAGVFSVSSILVFRKALK